MEIVCHHWAANFGCVLWFISPHGVTQNEMKMALLASILDTYYVVEFLRNIF